MTKIEKMLMKAYKEANFVALNVKPFGGAAWLALTEAQKQICNAETAPENINEKIVRRAAEIY